MNKVETNGTTRRIRRTVSIMPEDIEVYDSLPNKSEWVRKHLANLKAERKRQESIARNKAELEKRIKQETRTT